MLDGDDDNVHSILHKMLPPVGMTMLVVVAMMVMMVMVVVVVAVIYGLI